MADVFTVLAKDHEEVKRMLAELEKCPTKGTGASEDQLALTWSSRGEAPRRRIGQTWICPA
jgi:hypothetical protein